MSRRDWSKPAETLGNKAFSFGIFWRRFESVETRPLHCFVTEICRISIAWNPLARGRGRRAGCCHRHEALLRSRDDALKKVFPYYATNFGFQLVAVGKMASQCLSVR